MGTSNNSDAVAASLNRDLRRMKVWSDKWKVTFEPTKCKTMVVSRKWKPSKLHLYFRDSMLVANDELGSYRCDH
jgi:hypothetical protein